MNENKYDKKAEQKLLKNIYHKYVKDQGDQPSQLDVYQFNGLENYLYEDIPEILLEPLRTNIRPKVDHRYFMNLKDDDYIVNVNNTGLDIFKLTKPGFYEAKRLINSKDMKSPKEIEYPDKVTLKWLWDNISWKVWATFGSVIVASFYLGLSICESNLYRNLNSRTKEHTPIEKQKSIDPKVIKNKNTTNTTSKKSIIPTPKI